TASHLRSLMGDDSPVEVAGSLKAAAAPLAVDDAELAAIKAAIDARPVWLAASTHPGDEVLALTAHKVLLTIRPDALLILAPRDPVRASDIAEAVARQNMTATQRGAGEAPEPGCGVYIADTFGELGLWYRVADAALIGGTFNAVEGHNPWEAVALGCPMLAGPRTANFASDFSMLASNDAVAQVTDAASIATALQDPDLALMARRATKVREAASDGLRQTTEALIQLLDR
ncbi:MAG: 3-deoxy-D-manno-octulosonic acid transferase, partial [Pseudomonadota bacterium]